MTFKVWILDRSGAGIACKSINNAIGYDISGYVVNPKFIEEKLNEELDTAQITLEDYPQAKCLEPKTKIVLERWDDSGNLLQPFFHMIVTNDNVETYEGLSGYCTHRIELTEVSAIAQGYHVDSIAVTYELQDVDLDYDLNLDVDSSALNSFQNAGAGNTQNSSPKESPYWTREIRDSWSYATGFGALTSYTPPRWGETQGHYESNEKENVEYGPIVGVRSYKYEVEGNYGDIKNNIVCEVGKDASITLTIPRIKCYNAVENNATFTDDRYFPSNAPGSMRNKGYHNEYAYGTWELLTDCETKTTITVKDATTNEVLKTVFHIYKPYRNFGVSIAYYGKNVPKYESFNDDWHIAELYWDKAKEYMRLCGIGAESGATYQLALEGNKIYEIVTELNVPDGKGVIYSKTDAYTEYKMSPGVKRYTWFKTDTVKYGRPMSRISFQTTPRLILKDTPILRTPQKYNLLDTVRKAVLATGAHHKISGVPILETPTAFLINPHDVERLALTNINETVFYEKNLWEVCSAIGYYIHAIPYIEFENNEQFRISFKELGKNQITPVENKRITIFNSKDIEEYFGDFDSYVKNLYSPENIIDEYIPFKCESGEYLISNDTACGQTSKKILQVKEFYIVNSNGVEKNALSCIVEKSIYDTFSLDYERVPSKANAIYYTLNTNSIQGMNTSIPQKNELKAEIPYPIKAIIGKLFEITSTNVIKANDYYMHIVYNTSDSARMKQVRPDLNAMLLNSTFDKFPVHEQFYGQEDRIIDSERYGNLLYGELLKTGNGYYQTTEWNEAGAVKEVGDIMLIDKVPYYISQVESEWYDNIVLQKIVYHKDFNAISKIISIPCEPRFYEVANTSIIDRSPHAFENLTITTGPAGMLPERLKHNPEYISKDRFNRLIKGWLFGVDHPSYPDYAVTTFRDDPDTPHGAMSAAEMFVDTPKIEEAGKQILVNKVVVQNKILMYSSQNSLLFKWGMEDNYSAGSFVDTRVTGENNTANKAYYGLNFLRYCDLYGRADIMDFSLINNDAHDFESVRKLPQRVCSDKAIANAAIADCGRILNKDNREALRDISFQINLITDQAICFGRAVWRKKKKPVKILLLDEAISKFSFQNLYADKQANVIGEAEPAYNCEQTPDGFAYVEVGVDIPDALIDDVGCIAIVDSGESDNDKGGMPYIYKNVENLTPEQKRYSFYVVTA